MTRFLLDTNIVSELMLDDPHEGVVAKVRSVGVAGIMLSVLSVFEIRAGIERKPLGEMRRILEGRFNLFLAELVHSPLNVDHEVIAHSLPLLEQSRQAGTPLDDHLIDLLLAGTAAARGLTVISRNEAEFAATGVAYVNPWRSP